MTNAVSPLFEPESVVAHVANHETRFPEVKAGASFVDEIIEITPEYQKAMLQFSEIDEALYAGEVDPGLLARRPISVIGSALFNAHPERGYVHTVQTFSRLLPVPRGEPIAMTGKFTSIDDHPRGWIMHGRFEFRRADGELCLVVSPSALMADPERNTTAPVSKNAPELTVEERLQALYEAGWYTVGEKTCTPERVVGYCGKTRNLIHTDPAYAQSFGFRAPITAGNQMVEWHLEAVRRAHIGEVFEGSVRLQRPVFWDDELSVMRRDVGKAIEFSVVKSDGRVANSSTFKAIS
jgi:acyl dehydratase